jgi:predicted phage tail protein
MFARYFARQFAAILLALAVFLSGAGPSWATPAVDKAMSGMTIMAGMAMPCADVMQKAAPGKSVPCKNNDTSCAGCTACAVNVGIPQGMSPVTLLYQGEVRAISRNANRSGVATPPPLPPPILRA